MRRLNNIKTQTLNSSVKDSPSRNDSFIGAYDGMIALVGFLRAGLYDLILSFNLNEDQCYAGNAYLCSRMGISTRCLTNQLRKLQDMGLIYRNTYLTRYGSKRYMCTRENCNSHYKNCLIRSNAPLHVISKYIEFWASHGIIIDIKKDTKPKPSACSTSGQNFLLNKDLKKNSLKETTSIKKVYAKKLPKKERLPPAVVFSPNSSSLETINDADKQKKERAVSEIKPLVPKPVIPIFESLDKLDMPQKEKRWISKKYTKEIVDSAVKAALHPSTKIKTTPVQFVKWFCKDPDSVVIPKTDVEIVADNTPFILAVQLTMRKYGDAGRSIDGHRVEVFRSHLEIDSGGMGNNLSFLKYSNAKFTSQAGEILKIKTPTLFRILESQGFCKREAC